MNIKRTMLGAIVAGVAAVTPFVMPISASAQTAAVAAFSGSASATVNWVGPQNGTFTFGTSAPLGCTAAGVVNGGVVAGACTISASGSFTNVVCGTGLASGTATVSTSAGAVTTNFTIVFVASVGVLVPTPVPAPTATLPAGVVQITPNSLQLPTGAVCTNGFTVSAVSALVQA